MLAAHRAGIFTVILPDENKREVEEIPANVRDSMELIFVDHMDEVLEFALRKEADGYEKPTKEDFPEMPTTCLLYTSLHKSVLLWLDYHGRT